MKVYYRAFIDEIFEWDTDIKRGIWRDAVTGLHLDGVSSYREEDLPRAMRGICAPPPWATEDPCMQLPEGL